MIIEFKKFENSSNYLEYLQIFVYHSIHICHKDVVLEEYTTFELKDSLVKEYNSWITSINDKDPVFQWFSKNKRVIDEFKDKFEKEYMPKVCLWSDRNKTIYYKTQLQKAFEFENYIANLISQKYELNLEQYLTPYGQYKLGENALGIEIKNDKLIKIYGNVYIEYEEKSNPRNLNYINSGILKSDNCKYWLIGTEEIFYIFRKSRLLDIYNEELMLKERGQRSNRGILFKQKKTSKGFVYPIQNAIRNKDTITMDEMIEEIRMNL